MLGAVTTGPGEIHLEELAEVPPPAPDEITLAIEHVGICGSDLHIYHGTLPGMVYPVVQGHEISGRVVALPDNAARTEPLRAGDLVAVEPLLGCTRCYACRNGRHNCCSALQTVGVHIDGGLRQFGNFKRGRCHPVGDLSPHLAALCEPVSVGLHGVHRVQVTSDDRVVVFGAGLIGLSFALAAVDRGAEVVVLSRQSIRREAARRIGATAALDPADLVEFLPGWTGADGPSVVAETTGSPAVAQRAFDVVAYGGRVAMIGVSGEALDVSMRAFTVKELSVIGVRGTQVFPEAVELVRRHAEVCNSLVTQHFALDQVDTAFEVAAHTTGKVIKVMIDVAAHGST